MELYIIAIFKKIETTDNNEVTMKLNIKQGTVHVEDTYLKQFKNIKKVSFPKSLRSLPIGAFYHQKELLKVYFEQDIALTKIPESCFQGCISLKTMMLPKSIVSIEKYAFKDTTSLEEFDIPSWIEYIDPLAFDGWKDNQIIYIYDQKHVGMIKTEAEVVLLKEEDYHKDETSEGYYLVTVKGGHVGRQYYYPMQLPIRASSKKEASDRARYLPRVKKNHKDVVLSVEKISQSAFYQQVSNNDQDPYFNVTSKHQQNIFIEQIKDKLIKDPHYIQMKNKRKPKR